MESLLQHKTFKHLTPDQIDSFMTHGYVRIPKCFTREQAESHTKDVWVRLGMDPNDKSTWHTEKTNMPEHAFTDIRDIAPKAWDAICELAGGEDRVSEKSKMWSHGFIVNLGTVAGEGKVVGPKELDNWHVDGDFFVHFLDSPEQGLLVIPCWSDVKPNGGATWICDEGPKRIGQWLYDNPQGASPRMVPIGEQPKHQGLGFYQEIVNSCDDSSFHEMTGEVGDVILLHPLMLHSASKNGRRLARIITNPPVSLNEPFNFSRKDPSEYSLVELKTIKDLGKDNLADWHITGKREMIVPERLKKQAQMLKDEHRRLEEQRLSQSPQTAPQRVAVA